MRGLLLLVLACGGGLAGAAEEEHVTGRVIVKWKAGAATTAAATRALGPARLARRLGGAAHLYHAGDDAAARRLVTALAADPAVEWAELDRVRHRHGGPTPDDPLFGSQWTLPMAHIQDAWSRTRGSPSVVVAIVDTGITAHPDLADRTLPGYDFVSDPDNAADGDGRDGDPTDVGTSSVISSALHGTHVAGIVGAHVDNNLGIAGVDWGCRLLPVRVLGVQRGKGSDSDIADGIRWAAGVDVPDAPPNPTPAAIINLSFGGPGGSRILQEAVDEVVARGVIVVASAGNDAADTATYAPAGLNHVLAVGALDQQGGLTAYSNRGPRVDLVAPGGDGGATSGVLSTMRIDTSWTYAYLYGTSQAAPHVSGALAMALAVYPRLDAGSARQLVAATANPAYQCAEGCGAGLLDADAVVAQAQAWATCAPACGDGLECRQSRCVAQAIVLESGCQIAGPGGPASGASGGNRGPAAVMLAIAVAALGWRRRRRV